MKITFEEILSRKDWLHHEMLNSLPGEVISKAAQDGFYEVKLLVNGVELEPKLFNQIVTNIEQYIEDEAKIVISKKFEEAKEEAEALTQVVKDIIYNLREKYNIDVNRDDE